jgi:hypothetical protein
VDELAVVARQAKEPTQCPCRARYRPILNGLHLCRVHGDACLRDNVAEVCDGGDPECALGALDEEDMPSQLGKDHAEMPEMIRPRLVVYQYIVKENEHKATKEGAEYIVYKRLESCRALHRPNGMTRNSYRPSWVRNAVLWMSSFLMLT